MSTINSEFFEALALLEKERGIPMTYLIEKISNAIAVAIKRDMGGSENTIVEIDPVANRWWKRSRTRKTKSPYRMLPSTARWHMWAEW